MVFITLGKDGVLVGGPGVPPTLVRLHALFCGEVQAQLARYPGANCGMGDAFFAGVLAWYADGESLAAGLPNGAGGAPNSGICAAISGCAAAIRWTGYKTRLGLRDFNVAKVNDLHRFVQRTAA